MYFQTSSLCSFFYTKTNCKVNCCLKTEPMKIFLFLSALLVNSVLLVIVLLSTISPSSRELVQASVNATLSLLWLALSLHASYKVSSNYGFWTFYNGENICWRKFSSKHYLQECCLHSSFSMHITVFHK